MSAYTKKWIIEYDEDSCMGAMFIGQDRGDGVIADPICRVTDEDAAKLIAAAPELLTMIERIAKANECEVSGGFLTHEESDEIHALIAKAKS